jgi:SAM-dependent methyltransferase
MSLVGQVHDGVILGRRVERLTNLLGSMFPPAAHVLDVGSGDGKLAAELQRLRPDCRFEGIDVLVREGTAIPIRYFDGFTIPAADKSVDAVLLVDVLHHAADAAQLLRPRRGRRTAAAGVRARRTPMRHRERPRSRRTRRRADAPSHGLGGQRASWRAAAVQLLEPRGVGGRAGAGGSRRAQLAPRSRPLSTTDHLVL